MNFGYVAPGTTGPLALLVNDANNPDLASGFVIEDVPADATVTVSIDDPAFGIHSLNVYNRVLEKTRTDLQSRFHGQALRVERLELVTASDGSAPLQVSAGQLVFVGVVYRAPYYTDGRGYAQGYEWFLRILGTAWDPISGGRLVWSGPPDVFVTFRLAGVSTTILTATPVQCPRGQRVDVLIEATVEVGP